MEATDAQLTRNRSLFVFDAGEWTLTGCTADEVEQLLADARGKSRIYRIHRAFPDGRMEPAGRPSANGSSWKAECSFISRKRRPPELILTNSGARREFLRPRPRSGYPTARGCRMGRRRSVGHGPGLSGRSRRGRIRLAAGRRLLGGAFVEGGLRYDELFAAAARHRRTAGSCGRRDSRAGASMICWPSARRNPPADERRRFPQN